MSHRSPLTLTALVLAGVAAVPGDQRAVLDAWDRMTQNLALLRAWRRRKASGHTRAPAPRISAAAARTAVMMF